MDHRVRWGILGPLRVTDDAQREIVLPGRLRVLTAVLLTKANHAVSCDELAEVLWDGAPPPAATRTVRSYVMRLRRALGGAAAERIVTQTLGYLCRVEEDELDLLRVEKLHRHAKAAAHQQGWARAAQSLAEALDLWREAPLADVPSATLRAAWVPRLDQLRLQVLEDRIEADLHVGGHERVVAELRDLTVRQPLRERFHAQLMRALAMSGRQAEALEAYQTARRGLVEELGIEPGPELRSIQRRILDGDAKLAAPPPGTATPVADDAIVPAAPRQLPAAVPHFTGRAGELDALAALLGHAPEGRGTVVISAINGMAGIGKTALAVHAAHRLADRFPDGQLFIDLHGYTQGYEPRTPGEALEWFLRALDIPPQRIPADVEERAALYRQHLSGRRVLIVLDNAANEAQVRPLLPGSAGCLVLVTSRRRLRGLDDALALPLDLLPGDEAVSLVRTVAGTERMPADDPALAEVVDLCGRLPLALRIAAALLRHRPSWTLDHLAGLLRDQSQRLAALSDRERDLTAVFDLSLRTLTDPGRALFRRLGLIPTPDFDAHAVAALTGTDPATTTHLLEDLVDHNLLLSLAPGRYRLHDLLRAHARTQAARDLAVDRDAAVGRLLDYYQHTATRADARIARSRRATPAGPVPAHAPALDDPEAALAWLRAERPNLCASLDYAADRSWDDRVIALSAGLAGLLCMDGPWSEALRVHARALAIAERVNDRPARAAALLELATVRRISGDFPRAAHDIEAALALHRDLGDPRGQADVVRQRAILRYGSGDHPGAEQDLEAALNLYRDLGDELGQAGCLTHLGTVRMVTGDYPRAARDLQAALDLHRAHDNRRGLADTLTQLGTVRQMTGDYPGAARDLQAALDLHRGHGDRRGQAGTLSLLGAARQAIGDHQGAARNLEAALALYRDVGDRPGLAGALANLGTVRRTTGDHAGAARDLEAALALIREIGAPGGEAWALNQYAAVFADTGDHARALTLYRDALRLTREVLQADDEAIALEGIGECHLGTGEPEAGAAHLAQALEIFERLGMNPDAERVRARLSSRVPT